MSFFANILGTTPYQTMEKGYGQIIPGIQQATQASLGYLSPYQQVGTEATSDLYKHLQGMADPKAYLQSILSGYQMSPGAKFQEHEGTQALMNKAAALGLTGSGQEAKDIARYSQGLASQDMQQYLQNVLGIGQQYMGGMRGLGGMGLQAGLGMGREQMGGAEDIARIQEQQAIEKAREEAQREASLGTLGSDIGKFFGGPIGGALGGLLGGL